MKTKNQEQRRFSLEEIKEFSQALSGFKNDPASVSLAGISGLQGPAYDGIGGGIWSSNAGVRPGRFSAMPRARSLTQYLGVRKSEYAQEVLETMTGLTASSGTNATGWCDTPPGLGQLKTCQQTYTFGKYFIKAALNPLPEIGMMRTRAEVPGYLFNPDPALRNQYIPDIMYSLPDGRSALAHELFKVGAEMERSFGLVSITGNPATASASTSTGWIKEFRGLDTQIKTGYVDAITSVACPAMDSAVQTFTVDIGSVIGGGDGRNITQAVTDMYYGLKDRGLAVGMDVQFGIVIRQELWRALTEVWACQYSTYRCVGSSALPVVTDSGVTNALRLEMQNGMYLLVDGIQVPVFFADGIPSATADSITFVQDMYIVPLSWNGIPLIYNEYFDMGNQYTREYAQFADSDDTRVLNDGMYLVGARSSGICKEYLFASQWRVILDTPFLAGRIDDISFKYRAPTRPPYPGASGYVDGGATYRT